MKKSKISERIITIQTIFLILITIITIILEQNKPDWRCGVVLIFCELIFIPIQLLLNIILFKIKNEKWKRFLCILSAVLSLFIVINFIKFLMC